MFEKEALEITEGLRKAFLRTKNGNSFSFNREFKNPKGETYLRVRVAGYKSEEVAQYDVELETWFNFKVKGYVKRAGLFITADVDPTPENIIKYVNILLRYIPIFEACTILPSDCGKIREIHVIFEKIETDDYYKRTVRIPLRIH